MSVVYSPWIRTRSFDGYYEPENNIGKHPNRQNNFMDFALHPYGSREGAGAIGDGRVEKSAGNEPGRRGAELLKKSANRENPNGSSGARSCRDFSPGQPNRAGQHPQKRLGGPARDDRNNLYLTSKKMD